MMLGMAKSHQLKALGRACIAPAIFNINEPCVFGCIAWNPLLMLPMWINGFILPLFVYIFTKVIPFAPIPTLLFQLWYTPFPISTWLTTGAVTGIILAVAVFVISWCVWMPFFRVYDKQLCEKEATVASEGEKDE
jgi:PTS system cellobiose-specific IIC component